MKIIKKSYKFILGLMMGIIISSLTAYATTSYIISSDKVEYTDNSNLGVDNVQAAIDGTCSNIDSRLTELDELNTKMSEYKVISDTTINGINCVVWLQGNIVTIDFYTTSVESTITTGHVNSDYTFVILSEEYRPKRHVRQIFSTAGGKKFIPMVYTGGTVCLGYIYNQIEVGDQVVARLSYPI